MLDAADSIIALGTAGAALITSIANGVALVIKASRDRSVSTGISTDLVTLARNDGVTAPEDLVTPLRVAPAPHVDTPPAPAPSASPAGPPG